MRLYLVSRHVSKCTNNATQVTSSLNGAQTTFFKDTFMCAELISIFLRACEEFNKHIFKEESFNLESRYLQSWTIPPHELFAESA